MGRHLSFAAAGRILACPAAMTSSPWAGCIYCRPSGVQGGSAKAWALPLRCPHPPGNKAHAVQSRAEPARYMRQEGRRLRLAAADTPLACPARGMGLASSTGRRQACPGKASFSGMPCRLRNCTNPAACLRQGWTIADRFRFHSQISALCQKKGRERTWAFRLRARVKRPLKNFGGTGR